MLCRTGAPWFGSRKAACGKGPGDDWANACQRRCRSSGGERKHGSQRTTCRSSGRVFSGTTGSDYAWKRAAGTLRDAAASRASTTGDGPPWYATAWATPPGHVRLQRALWWAGRKSDVERHASADETTGQLWTWRWTSCDAPTRTAATRVGATQSSASIRARWSYVPAGGFSINSRECANGPGLACLDEHPAACDVIGLSRSALG